MVEGRAIPSTRDGIARVLADLHLPSTVHLLDQTRGLSLSDQYWVRDMDEDVRWQDVNFFTNPFPEQLGYALLSERSSSHRFSFDAPDASTGGDLPKRWTIGDDGTRLLVKTGRTGQEPVNELIASQLAGRLGLPAVRYTLGEYENRPVSICAEMLTDTQELVSAWQALGMVKHNKTRPFYTTVKSPTARRQLHLIRNWDRYDIWPKAGSNRSGGCCMNASAKPGRPGTAGPDPPGSTRGANPGFPCAQCPRRGRALANPHLGHPGKHEWRGGRARGPRDGRRRVMMVRMIPNITRGSNPAGLVRYLFGPGRKNEHRDQHLVCASGDMLDMFDLSGRPTATYEQIGRVFDRRYRRLRRDGRACPPNRSPGGKHNPEGEDGKDRVWHCSLSIPAAHGALSDAQWEKIVTDYLTRMNIIDGPDDETASWIAVRHGLSANGNDHVHIAVQLALDDGWANPYNDRLHAQRACRHLEKTDANLEQITRRRPLDDAPYQWSQWRRWAEWKARYDWIEEHGTPWDDLDEDERIRLTHAWDTQPEPVRRRRINHIAAATMPRMHIARLVEACAIASDTEDEFIRRVRREGLQIDPFLRKGTGQHAFCSPGQVTGYRITWRSADGWTERCNTTDLGDGFRLKTLREHWRHDPHEDALAVLEWKAAMANMPPAIHDGAERRAENLSTHDLERMIDTAFRQAMRMRDADPDDLRGIILDGIRAFDRMRDRYGVPPSIIDVAPIRLPGTDTEGRKT